MSTCPRQTELQSHLRSGDWPHAAPDLREHVRACARCGRHLLLSQAFQRARSESVGMARLEPPALLWWRAQLRRRREVYEQISRPIDRAQWFALLLTLAGAVGFTLFEGRHGVQWLDRLEALRLPDSSTPLDFWPFNAISQGSSPVLLLVSLAALAVMCGVAFYLAQEAVGKTRQGRN